MKCLFVLFIAATGCTFNKQTNPRDSPTSGCLVVAVDESLQPLIDAEIVSFMSIYKKTSISPMYVSEAEAVRLLLSDSVPLAIITRNLSGDERAQIRQQEIVPQEAVVAREGIAVVMHPDKLSMGNWLTSDLKTFLRTGITEECETCIDQVIFDHAHSGIARFIRDSLIQTQEMPLHAFAVYSSESVIQYVSEHPSAIGLVGASWISDKDDPTSLRFLSQVHVAALGHDGHYYQPYQAYIAERLYPLTRDVVMCSREARSGLATGFMSFVAGDKGQRIVLKAGLVPTTMPIRLVEIKNDPL